MLRTVRQIFLGTFRLLRYKTKEATEIQKTELDFKNIKFATKVPQLPQTNCFSIKQEEIIISDSQLQLIERLSLVDIESKEALRILKESIKFAKKIENINTVDIDPLYTVLEDNQLKWRDDNVTECDIKENILKNAKITEEDYFVSPPGNIPLEQTQKEFEK